MKKIFIISISILIFLVSFVSANLLDERIGGNGTIEAGNIANTYAVDGYVLHIKGEDHIFRTQQMKYNEIMYLGVWFDDIKKDQNIEIYNYNTSSWDLLGTGLTGLKIGLYYEINMTNYYNSATNTTDIKISSQNGDAYIDKIIFSSSSVLETIKRVEQVDFVNNVGNVDSVNTVDEVQEPEIDMHGTEYFSDEPVKVWLQLLDGNNTPIDGAVCYLWVYSPVNTLYITRANMYYVDYGIYAYDFDAPFIGGVYPAISICYFVAEQDFHYAEAFTPYVYSSETNDYTYTYVRDISDHEIKETVAGSPKRIAIQYNFSNVCNGSNPDTLTGFSVGINIKWQSSTDDNLYLWYWNWSSGGWTQMPNFVNFDTDRLLVSNSYETNNLSRDGYTDENGTFLLYINDTSNTDGGATIAYIDHLYATCDILAYPEFQLLKGSSEVHVTLDETSITGYILDITSVFLEKGSSEEAYEGDIEINFSMYSRVLEITDITHYFDLPKDLTCSDIHRFSWKLQNGTVIDFYPNINLDNFTCIEDYTKDIVQIKWDRTVNYNQVDEYELVLHNRLKRFVIKYQSNIDSYKDDMNLMCVNYFYMNGFGAKPSLPLNSTPNYGDDFADGCANFWNTYYHFNQSIYEANITEVNITDDDSFSLYEEHIHRIKSFYDILVNDFIIGSGVVNMYSQYTSFAPAASTAFQTWGPLSTNEIINQFLRVNMSSYVWNYTTRQITQARDTFIGQTEYDVNEATGKIVVRMTDVSGDPVVGANCYYGIFYPNNTVYIYNISMIEHTGGVMGGIYYADFNLTNIIGVYPYGVDCIKGGKDYFLLNTFHIRNISNEVWSKNVTINTSILDQISNDVWTNNNRTLTNFSNVAGDVWADNQTINQGLLGQITSNVWSYIARYIHGEII